MVSQPAKPIPLIVIDGEVSVQIAKTEADEGWEHRRFVFSVEAARWLMRSGVDLAVHHVCELDDSLAFLTSVSTHWRRVRVLVTYEGDSAVESALRTHPNAGCFRVPDELHLLRDAVRTAKHPTTPDLPNTDTHAGAPR